MKIDVENLEYNIYLGDPANTTNYGKDLLKYIIQSVTVLNSTKTIIVAKGIGSREIEIYDDNNEYVDTTIVDFDETITISFRTNDLFEAIHKRGEEVYLCNMTVKLISIDNIVFNDIEFKKYEKYVKTHEREYLEENAEFCIAIK